MKNIPIILSANNNYAPYLGVCIQSIIYNSSKKYNYIIYILSSNIDENYQSLIKSMNTQNISINFFDMSQTLDVIDTKLFSCPSYGNDFYSPETYYRLFLPTILEEYDKVLYLDSDMIINKDIADLFNIDIGNNLIGVTHDLSLLTSMGMNSGWSENFLKYVKDTLLLENLDNYFQAGVMIWNLKRCREENLTKKFLCTLQRIGTPIYVDQDVMNSTLAGKNIFWIDQNWDVVWDILFWYKENLIPEEFKTEYIKNLSSPAIIHYTSAIKPWNTPHNNLSQYFWKYARMSPFYEDIIYKNIKSSNNNSYLENIIRDISSYYHNLFNYYRCKIMRIFTFGKRKNHYKQKRNKLKEKLRNVHKFLKQNN